MNYELLILFIALNAVNVVIQTIKSLCTINGGKMVAATANAIAYGLYTVVVIYMVCDLPLWWKVLIVGACNFVGVWVVKYFEERMRRDKLWKVEATIPAGVDFEALLRLLKEAKVPYNYIDIDKYYLLNCYCATQELSVAVKKALDLYDAKYFVSESKNL